MDLGGHVAGWKNRVASQTRLQGTPAIRPSAVQMQLLSTIGTVSIANRVKCGTAAAHLWTCGCRRTTRAPTRRRRAWDPPASSASVGGKGQVGMGCMNRQRVSRTGVCRTGVRLTAGRLSICRRAMPGRDRMCEQAGREVCRPGGGLSRTTAGQLSICGRGTTAEAWVASLCKPGWKVQALITH